MREHSSVLVPVEKTSCSRPAFLEAFPKQGSEGKKKLKTRGKLMSQNLNLLRQKYCRTVTVTGKRSNYLFPLEKECDEGKALTKAPETLFYLQEFDPCGLQQTYRDEATGGELPVFAVFNLEGNHRLIFEITTDSVPTTANSGSLFGYIPFQKTQAFVRKMNERRMKAELAITPISLILGIFPALAYILTHITVMTGTTALGTFVGWVIGPILAYILSLRLLDWLRPWKKLVISAEFNGILPREAREKARAAKDHFDNLYLIVDQEHRWKSAFLADPKPRALDPLLVGELKQGRRCKFFVIHQFDLSEAEQYLADEFVTKLDGDFAFPPTTES
jgi:hypothetical protein